MRRRNRSKRKGRRKRVACLHQARIQTADEGGGQSRSLRRRQNTYHLLFIGSDGGALGKVERQGRERDLKLMELLTCHGEARGWFLVIVSVVYSEIKTPSTCLYWAWIKRARRLKRRGRILQAISSYPFTGWSFMIRAMSKYIPK